MLGSLISRTQFIPKSQPPIVGVRPLRQRVADRKIYLINLHAFLKKSAGFENGRKSRQNFLGYTVWCENLTVGDVLDV